MSEFLALVGADDLRATLAEAFDGVGLSSTAARAARAARVGEEGGEGVEEVVFAAVEVGWRGGGSGCGAGVAVAASVAGPVVDPVCVHPPTAYSARHQAGQFVVAVLADLGRPIRSGPLYREERGVVDQWLVGEVFGDLPLPYRVPLHRAGPPAIGAAAGAVALGALPVPYLPAGVAGILQDHRDGPYDPPLAGAMPIPARVGAGGAGHAAVVELTRQ
jgi:hypothetical protein